MTIARNSLWTLVDNLLGLLGMLLASVAVARALGPTKVGHYNYLMWVVGASGALALLGIPAATRKFAAQYLGLGQVAVARTIVSATYRLQAALALLVALVGTTVVLLRVAPEHRTYALLAVASLVPALLLSISTAAIAATEDLRPNVRASVISTLVNLAGTAVTLLVGWELVGLAGSLLLSRVVDLMIRFASYRRLYARLGSGEGASTTAVALPAGLAREMARFAGQAALLLALELLVWDRSEVLFLEWHFPSAEVAFYTVPFNVAAHLLMLPRVLASSAEATMVVHQQRDPARIARVTATALRLIILFIVPAAAGLAAVSGPVIQVLYQAPYAPAIPVLSLLALFTVARAVQLPAVSLLIAADRQRVLLALGLGLGLLNLLGNWLVVPRAGALGAALVKGGVQVAAAALLWIYLHRRLAVPLALATPARVVLVSALMFAVVRALVLWLPPLPGLLLGVPLGVALVVLGLRVLRCVHPEDRDRLLDAAAMLPVFARDPFVTMVGLVAPRA